MRNNREDILNGIGKATQVLILSSSGNEMIIDLKTLHK